MIAVFSPYQILHNPPKEFISNEVVAYGESPERAELIYEALMDEPGIKLERAAEFDILHFGKIHSAEYLNYLRNAYTEWVSAGLWDEGILPEFFAIGKMRELPVSSNPVGKAGFYMTDSCTMIVKDTWEAVRFSGFAALTGARFLLSGEKAVFSLCRPPGHHAGYDYAGGYCFVNNAALAAKFLQDEGRDDPSGSAKVGILDLDFHHGNGTQDVVQHLDNVIFVSVHGDPRFSYPYITGFESENRPCNINYPLPPGITDDEYFKVICRGLDDITSFGASYLVVSLGVDTFEHDHQGNFSLTSGIYRRIADYMLNELKIPVLIIMEGGYNIEFLADNVLSFLRPFSARYPSRPE